MRLGPLLATVALLALLALLAGCGSSRNQIPAQRSASPVAHLSHQPRHIAIVVMENEEFSAVIGSHSTPYISGLARRYSLAESAYAVRHPSLPNYLALTGGSTFAVKSDCTDCAVAGAGLAGQLRNAGISWKAYMESMPSPCFRGSDSGEYAKKHDPFMYFKGITSSPQQCRRVVPMSRLSSDERAHELPRFIWVTPNLCHDMHDCSTAVGDRFLHGLAGPLLRAMGPNSLLILTWDEGSSDNGCCKLASGGHIVTIVAGPDAKHRARMRTAVDHYSVLQLVDDLMGLERLGAAACDCTASLAPLLGAS